MPKSVVAAQIHSNPVPVPVEGLQMSALAAITTHPNNPRKQFDPDSLKELAASIQAHRLKAAQVQQRQALDMEAIEHSVHSPAPRSCKFPPCVACRKN